MNTMKFYKVRRINGELKLITLPVKIDQRVGQRNYGEQRGTSRRDACTRAFAKGFFRTKREAVMAVVVPA